MHSLGITYYVEHFFNIIITIYDVNQFIRIYVK
jgi:hypothetical protein